MSNANSTTRPSDRRFCTRNWALATCGHSIYFIDGTYYAVDSFKDEPIHVAASDTDITLLLATIAAR